MKRDLQVIFASATAVRPGPVHVVEGTALDDVRRHAHALLTERGYRIRSLSFTPTGLLAYVADPEA
jgi:hypothetical protein